jgi:hypothetical protein
MSSISIWLSRFRSKQERHAQCRAALQGNRAVAIPACVARLPTSSGDAIRVDEPFHRRVTQRGMPNVEIVTGLSVKTLGVIR